MNSKDFKTATQLISEIHDLDYMIETLNDKTVFENKEEADLTKDSIENLKKLHNNKCIVLKYLFNDVQEVGYLIY